MHALTVALVFCLSLTSVAIAAEADDTRLSSSSFCLYELPGDPERRVWINLGIVQYVELRSSEVRIYYGGGNLGSGHEARIPLRSKDDGMAVIRRMQATAVACNALPSSLGKDGMVK